MVVWNGWMVGCIRLNDYVLFCLVSIDYEYDV